MSTHPASRRKPLTQAREQPSATLTHGVSRESRDRPRRIESLTNCDGLQREFDTADASGKAARERGDLDKARLSTDYMIAADKLEPKLRIAPSALFGQDQGRDATSAPAARAAISHRTSLQSAKSHIDPNTTLMRRHTGRPRGSPSSVPAAERPHRQAVEPLSGWRRLCARNRF